MWGVEITSKTPLLDNRHATAGMLKTFSGGYATSRPSSVPWARLGKSMRPLPQHPLGKLQEQTHGEAGVQDGVHPSGLLRGLTVVMMPAAAEEAADAEAAMDTMVEVVAMVTMVQELVKRVEETSESRTISSSMTRSRSPRNSGSQEAKARLQKSGGKL